MEKTWVTWANLGLCKVPTKGTEVPACKNCLGQWHPIMGPLCHRCAAAASYTKLKYTRPRRKT